MMPLFNRLGIILVMRPMLYLLTRYRVVGRDNVPGKGPLVVVSNHVSMVDPPLLSTSIPRGIAFMAKEEIFSSVFQGPMARWWGAFPVRRGSLDREALRLADQALRDGMALGIFPEAKRSESGQLQPAYTGAALIALRNDCQILPVGIIGGEKFNKLDFIFKRPGVTVNIGRPFTLPHSGGRLNKEQLAPATDMIMNKIAELLPEAQRGHYGNREGV